MPEESHPVEQYLNLLRSLKSNLELETYFGFREVPSFGKLPESLPIPQKMKEEEIPVYPEPKSNIEIHSEEEEPHRALFATTQAETKSNEGVTRSILSPEFKKAGLAKLEQQVSKCTACRLSSSRINTVFGYGNPNAELIFIGEAPGADEDRQGLPFVGKAGQLLTRIINSIKLTREDVYIMNLIKCRPPANRDPKVDEIELCRPFILRQLNFLEPKLICTLGRFASQNLLNESTPISRLRGKVHYWKSIPVIPTFHPSYLLHQEWDPIKFKEEKRKVWEDMKKIRELLQELKSKN